MFDYYCHLKYSKEHHPEIYFTPDSIWDETNPWLIYRKEVLKQWVPRQADIIFLGGLDWLYLPERERTFSAVPIVNLIQHVRHADSRTRQFSFLSNKAIRICVSQEVTDAIMSTGLVNGPVYTIPNGLDLSIYSSKLLDVERSIDISIFGLKKPELAATLEYQLKTLGIYPNVVTARLPREAFLKLVASTKIAVFLPDITEGFYLPALEGMALGSLVICPDCIGNRGFCKDGLTCFCPEYNLDAITKDIIKALHLKELQKNTIIANAFNKVEKHSILNERNSFLKLITNITKIYCK